MADISMCRNSLCPSKSECYRFTAPPNPYRQTYKDFHHDDSGRCAYFAPITIAATRVPNPPATEE